MKLLRNHPGLTKRTEVSYSVESHETSLRLLARCRHIPPSRGQGATILSKPLEVSFQALKPLSLRLPKPGETDFLYCLPDDP